MEQTKSQVYNCSDVFFSCLAKNDTMCAHKMMTHVLVYVHTGELFLEERGRKIHIHAGECVFIRRDHKVVMTKKSYGEEPYKGVTMQFKRNFLREYFNKACKGSLPAVTDTFKESVIPLPKRPDLESLFVSMTPYFDYSVKPTEELINLKMQEGLLCLLNIDKRFHPSLFDFSEPWKIDILEFLNENYMYDLSLEEIASFTGRSLATFKRDFKKISNLSPQKWLIKKRLEVAYDKIRSEGKKVGDVYVDVGFKNRSHFTTAFKREYGFAPSH